MIQASPTKSNPKWKQKNLPPKTPNKTTWASFLNASSSATFWYVLVCFGMFWYVSRCFEMFWETSCRWSKPQTRKPTHFANTSFSNCTLSTWAYLWRLPIDSSNCQFVSNHVNLCQIMSNKVSTCSWFKLLYKKATQNANKKFHRNFPYATNLRCQSYIQHVFSSSKVKRKGKTLEIGKRRLFSLHCYCFSKLF